MDFSISFLVLLLLQTPISSSKTYDNNILRQGSSLSVEKSSDQFISPNGVYSAGFFSVVDNAFSFAVWFTKFSPLTAAWMANRDMPVNGKGSKLSLLKNGDLSLTDAVGIHIWNSKLFRLISESGYGSKARTFGDFFCITPKGDDINVLSMECSL
ncbi:hypothetical protein Dsin_003192 [Dipteronia sinensis]|uniref:Bulb-type lectin domain-containing protein n=1 Tax=Dipteronia sinensis TaxID=43782 RepID=A0AAE0B776_9ROSI|nr:hypothetical protein Dsin_003192 [Dipteronia sinensis]